MRLLLLTDNLSMLTNTLNAYQIDRVEKADDAIINLKSADYNLMVLLAQNSVTALHQIQRIRREKLSVPILVLNHTHNSLDAATYLNSGADDCIFPPFNERELFARISAVIRRSYGHCESAIMIDQLTLDMGKKRVLANDQDVPLTTKEYNILELMFLRQNRILSKEMILNHLYGGMDEPEAKIVDVFICKIRKKLADATGGINYIKTIWGRGYCLEKCETRATAKLEDQRLLA